MDLAIIMEKTESLEWGGVKGRNQKSIEAVGHPYTSTLLPPIEIIQMIDRVDNAQTIV